MIDIEKHEVDFKTTKFEKNKGEIAINETCRFEIDGEKYECYMWSDGLQVVGEVGTGRVSINVSDILHAAHLKILKCKKENGL